MILIGDSLIPHKSCFFIDSIMDIENTEPNSTLIFNYDENILLFCRKNDIKCAVIVNSIKEAIYCNALNSKYIICDKKLASSIQKVAENYIFDSKVLAIIETSDEIEKVALAEIDGVIYSHLLNK
ncbi:hypothetical protein CRV08_01455 [Halarcobacter ebronensis]|uniref:Uncharacterized protein n=1 Tax=Halarcobacter ebronensis TaxID=1462615 RepID=A0A4Q0YHV9_9BACT|nr:hypothetical protein [Halarcobacter ebronensis]RXJ70257.1 hypothetical protein CRV08_01455 [Halarcobacter ebronensis]